MYSWALKEFPRSILYCSLVSFLFSSQLRNHGCEALWVQLWASLWDTIPQQSPWSSGPYLYSTPLPHLSLSLRCGKHVADSSSGIGLKSSTFWFVVISVGILHLLQKEVRWWGIKTLLICTHKSKYLQITFRDYAVLVNWSFRFYSSNYGFTSTLLKLLLRLTLNSVLKATIKHFSNIYRESRFS